MVDRIQSDGVSAFELPFELTEADLNMTGENTYNNGLARIIGNFFSTVLETENGYSRSNGAGKLLIRTKKNDPAEVSLQSKQIARMLVEDEEGSDFKIVLGDATGSIINGSELKTKKTVEVERHGAGVDVDQMWGELIDFAREQLD